MLLQQQHVLYHTVSIPTHKGCDNEYTESYYSKWLLEISINYIYSFASSSLTLLFGSESQAKLENSS